MKKIAILYIATGKYIEFWDRFYNECEQYFLRNHEKTYFIWTDADEFTHQNNLRVHTIYQEQLHWPFPTLLRFKFFRTQKELLKDYDYIYFFNANISFLADLFLCLKPFSSCFFCFPIFLRCSLIFLFISNSNLIDRLF